MKLLLTSLFFVLPVLLLVATLAAWTIGLTGTYTVDLSPVWGSPPRKIWYGCHDPELVSPCAVISDDSLLVYVHAWVLSEPADVRLAGLFVSHSPIYPNSPNSGLAINLIAIPWWMLLLFFAIPPTAALTVRRPLRRRHRKRNGLCTRCGYNLKLNTSGICPECGTPIPLFSRTFHTPEKDRTRRLPHR